MGILNYKQLLKELFCGHLRRFRQRMELSQDEMAERLRVSSRAYGDLERGKYCFSAVALLFFFSQLPEREVLELLKVFVKKAQALENQDAA